MLASASLQQSSIGFVASAFACVVGFASVASPAISAQIDIHGPPGSSLFGWHVAVLPNGNIVVTDPYFSTASTRHVGAIYLYDPSGGLISTLTGSSENDNVGDAQIRVLHNGNVVVSSQQWNNGGAVAAGAVTWINGATGLSGVVSAQNSLVGTSTTDSVGGYDGIVELSNGNYVVASAGWSNADANNAGAVTWANGATGISGAVSAENSLVGTLAGDLVGEEQSDWPGVVALANGNYVVTSGFWHYGSTANPGAVTLGNGNGGTAGPVSAANSLVGTTICYTDVIGLTHQIVPLANGNFLVPSPCWSQGTETEIGAVTWVDGVRGLSGEVSDRNSFIGSVPYEHLGQLGITALSNGNYVLLSPNWDNGKGAATWANGRVGRVGRATRGNSLVGANPGDHVGGNATALADGNYVVGSPWWNGPQGPGVGALTWGDGAKGSKGTVTAANSLVGAAAHDFVGFGSVAALPNGDYAVASPYWSNGAAAQVGAVTWVHGSAVRAAVVGPGNSIVGSQPNDRVGGGGVIAVGSGNYVALSPDWSNGAAKRAGAATWVDGSGPRSGVVSEQNSLVGTTPDDALGYYGSARLANGNFVVASPGWHDAVGNSVGAFTWFGGDHGLSGVVSPGNSLVGTPNHSGSIVTALSDGNYVISNRFSLFGEIESNGSVTLADGPFGLAGTIAPWNSVISDTSGYSSWVADYDPARKRLVVGRPDENTVTLFTVSEKIFASGFEP